MKTVDQHREEFESFYKESFHIRNGAYGIASNHLTRNSDGYISNHAALCWMMWFKSALENEK